MARFGDGLAVDTDLVHAAESAVRQAVAPLPGPPDLLCAFVCGDDPDALESAGRRAMEVAGATVALGCSAGGVIGAGQGVERASAVSAFAAHLPDVRCTPLRLDYLRTTEGAVITGVAERRDDDAVAVVLADPMTFPVEAFVSHSPEILPGIPLVGGLASGPQPGRSARLFLDGEVVPHGAVGALLGGSVSAHALVSQGCRPIGPAMTVTKAEHNMLLELAGTPAMRKLQSIVSALPETERTAAASGLQLGIAMNEYADEHDLGDFLIRAVLGADRGHDAIAVGDVVEVGRTVRFHVRDAASADKDLERLFARSAAEVGPVEGALLFSCNGRGAAMFPSADHDVLAVRRGLGVDGVGGFFAAGEIGPVAGRNYLHGFTASILAFGAG